MATARGTGAKREERIAPNVHKHHSHDHMAEVRQLFSEYDSNKDGRLTLDEVARLIKEMGMNEEDAPMEFKLCGLDCKGTWNWEEFKNFHDRMIHEARRPDKTGGGHVSYKEREGNIRSDIQIPKEKLHPLNWDAMHALFKAFDTDKDDSLDKLEVCDLLRIWGTPLDKHALEKEWPNWDINFDGLINWGQFKRLVEVLHERNLLHEPYIVREKQILPSS